jgi:hypothetical protein
MPDPTPQQRLAALRRFAQRRTGMGVIVATLGPLSDAERQFHKQQQGIVELQAGEHKARGAKSTSDRIHETKAQHSLVDLHPCEDPKRRARLERDDVAWMRWYCADSFYLPFEKPHIAIIEATREAIIMGRDTVIAAERGVGKSYIEYALVMKLALSGEQAFPVYLPWGEKNKAQGFGFWLDCLAFNERIAADYPEICAPFVHALGVSQRVAATVWRHTGQPTHARIAGNAGVIVFPDARGIIGSSTINGNPRGLNYKHKGGKSVRPTMAFVDDVQDDKVARSQGPDGLVKKTIRTVNGAVRGLKRAGGTFSIIMTGNCIERGDVMDHFLNQAGWTAVRVSCVECWPDGWDDPKSQCRELWEQWGQLWLGADKGESAFFRQHKDEMCRGMVLNSPKAYMHKVTEDGKDKRNKRISRPVNAFHAVLREYFTMGHEAFMAERQQSPIDPVALSGPYTLTPEIIMGRKTKRRAHEKPDWVAYTVASTDCNPSYALTSTVTGYGVDGTAAVMWYGLHPVTIADDMPEVQFGQALFNELVKHGKDLAVSPNRPDVWAIDAGGKQFDAVVRFCMESVQACGIQAVAFTGRGAKGYKTYGRTAVKGQIREQCHGCMDRKSGRVIRWVAWNADYWKEMSQRAWLGEVGSPGSASLPDGQHSEFAGQVCADKLLGKGEVGGMMLWNFGRVPGKNNYGDAMAQSYAAAAYAGIGTSGGVVRRKKTIRAVITGRTGANQEPDKKQEAVHEQDDAQSGAETGQGTGKRRAVIGRRKGW